MYIPSREYENKLKRNGYKIIAGIDEAGRGALAGPVTVAVVVAKNLRIRKLNVRDSKLLSSKQREEAFEIITQKFDWAVGMVNNKIIDKKGINWAVTLALRKALKKLEVSPDFLILDAGINLPAKNRIPFQSIIKADRDVFLCSCASIVAKVWRDRLMVKYGKKFPNYKFEKHKGYGTREHFEMICRYGICDIHRASYKIKYKK